MLISYKHKFIFIHNYKVAGNSINRALKKYSLLNPPTIHKYNKVMENIPVIANKINWGLAKTEIIPNFKSHDTAEKIKEKIPEQKWDKFFKFGFVRNPWDWQVSLYHYALQQKSHFQHELIKNMKNFDEYIDWRISQKINLQKNFFYDPDGNKLVDFIGKFRNLDTDFEKIVRIIGLDIKLPHVNKSKHKNYKKYYNNFTKRLIEKHYDEDINLFNYSF